MAINKLVKRNIEKELVYTAVTTAGVNLVPDANDSRTLLVFKNAGSSSVNITISKGTSSYGAENDLIFAVAGAKEVVVSLDSALYKDMAIDGYKVKGSATGVSVACITLP